MIDGERLRRFMDEVSAFGATKGGGVDRPAGTREHGRARDWLRGQLEAAGLRVAIDPIGNLFGILEWAGPDAPLILTGSHLDSQPNGGRFDGAYGVVASLEAILALKGHAQAHGLSPRCNLALVDWMNEEGARFQPSLLGSSVFGGQLTLDYALSRKDGDGVSVETALRETGYLGKDEAPNPVSYLEMHVECGGDLEASGRKIGPFARHWGALKVKIKVTGRQTHTGPTPMAHRQDALLGAAYLIAAIRDLSPRAADTLYTSVGRIEVIPNSPNIVPGEALLFAELRSPEMAVLEWAEGELNAALGPCADKAGVRAEILSIDRRPAGRFAPGLVRLAQEEAEDLGLSTQTLDTIGGHDAIPVLARCPAIVVAVPSVGGICHNAVEFTPHEDLENGTRLLTRMLWRLDRMDGRPSGT
nr:Zn-dependent hydrolase [Arboricoccus pini]